MTVKAQTYSVRDLKYRHREVYRRRKIAKEGSDYPHTEVASWVDTDFSGDFEIKIDVPTIIAMMVERAKANRTGRAKMLNGLLTVTSKRTVIKNEITEIPVREGYRVVGENK
jgi:hypothetical protein